jgi:hypothetical protein
VILILLLLLLIFGPAATAQSNAPQLAPLIVTYPTPAFGSARTLKAQPPLTTVDTGNGGQVILALPSVPVSNGGTGGSTAQEGINNLLGLGKGGELMYFDGKNWKQLPAGSNGAALTMTNGIPSWSFSNVAIPATTKVLTADDETAMLPNSVPLKLGQGLMLEDGAIAVDHTIPRGMDALLLSPSIQNLTLLGPSFPLTILADPTSPRKLSIPDPGVDSGFVLDDGIQTIHGELNVDNLSLKGLTLTVGGFPQEFPPLADTLVDENYNQTLSNKTFNGIVVDNVPPYLKLVQSGGSYNISWQNPGSDRIYQFYDANQDGDICIKKGICTNGGVAYGDGNLIKFTNGAAAGMPLVSQGIGSPPAFTVLSAAFGGTGIMQWNPGDLMYCDTLNHLTRLPLGKPGQVLTVTSDGKGVTWR